MELTSLLLYITIFFSAILVLILFSDGDLTLMLLERFGKRLSSVKGQVYWIVGASSGIGEYLAYELVANGAKVVLSGRRENELQKVKAQCLIIGKKAGLSETDILLLPVDVTKLELHQQYFDAVLKHFGTLDVLVNNAGRSQRAEWMNIDIRVDKDLFEGNVFGLLNLSRTVIPHFLAKKKGQIAVTSSVCGKVGAPCSASYNATKHALHGYFETLRAELTCRGISVTMLCPGPVFSDLLSACATDTYGQKLGSAMTKKDRRMSTERCARLCAIAMVNQLDEAWISINPVLLSLYVSQYAPSLFRSFNGRVGARVAMSLRDSRNDLVNSCKKDVQGEKSE
ncbi:hypothetical protein GHT06_012208 [Daphnia sinensis]|uniref:Dehydrogenase/reductase SDR family member 7 n=1 Tax=Daphnia sinensis TaxID=1820382 RepID=A0AAD5KVG4_9CRUS|nr:hypothetical protein GHT06_012208 [Daphnia sinensis]